MSARFGQQRSRTTVPRFIDIVLDSSVVVVDPCNDSVFVVIDWYHWLAYLVESQLAVR